MDNHSQIKLIEATPKLYLSSQATFWTKVVVWFHRLVYSISTYSLINSNEKLKNNLINVQTKLTPDLITRVQAVFNTVIQEPDHLFPGDVNFQEAWNNLRKKVNPDQNKEASNNEEDETKAPTSNFENSTLPMNDQEALTPIINPDQNAEASNNEEDETKAPLSPPKDADLSINKKVQTSNANPTETETFNLILETTKHFSFFHAILKVYEKQIEECEKICKKKNKKEVVYPFFLKELTNIYAQFNFLKEQKDRLIDKHNQELNQETCDFEQLKQIEKSIKIIEELDCECNRLIASIIEKQIETADSKIEISKRKGIYNVGNICYMSASLQPLLAIKHFESLVPGNPQPFEDESEENFEKRKEILNALKAVIEAYHTNNDAEVLGQLVGFLRMEIFKAGLAEGGFIDPSQEYGFQDAGSFLELILHTIGQKVQLEIKKTYKSAYKDPIIELNPMGCLLIKQKTGSIQEKINNFSKPYEERLTEGNGVKDDYGNYLYEQTEVNQIISSPPELLVFRVQNYQVKETDTEIDALPLFSKEIQKQLNNSPLLYELTGFAQNHSQVHWTATARSINGWTHCNDSTIENITPQDEKFQKPASYLIYKKKTL